MGVFAQTSTPTVTWDSDDGSVTVVGEKTFIYTSENSNSPTNIVLHVGQVCPMPKSGIPRGIMVSGIANPVVHTSPEIKDFSISGDGVQLFVNYYDLYKNEKLKPIYGTFATEDASNYQEGYWLSNSSYLNKELDSKSIRDLMFVNRPVGIFYNYNTPTKLKKFSPKSIRPVYIEVKVKNATLHSLNIPGIGEKTAAQLFNDPNIFTAHLTQIKTVFENPQSYNYSIVAAHRGYWAEPGVPENTIEAFHRAYEIGADLIEIDVRQTSDGTPVACHDEYLYRLYDITDLAHEKNINIDSLKIGQITVTEFKALNTKDRFGSDLNIHPNTIEEILDEFKHHLISLDIKDENKGSKLLWSESFKKCLLLAQSKGVLGNMVIKGSMSATGVTALFTEVNNDITINNDPQKIIDFTKFYFTPVMYGRFNSDGSRIDPAVSQAEWESYITSSQIKAVECHFKVATDPLLMVVGTQQSYVDWLHGNHIRVGIYNFYADVPTGVLTMETNGSLGVREYTPDINYDTTYVVPVGYDDPANPQIKLRIKLTDNRGNLDWCIGIGKPNYFIYDRPVMLMDMLEAFGMRNLIVKQ
ncbi:hypothetical protein BST83_11675 [Polaribacter filamentus]|uniref:GP-PDE domain-containing protein n=1 Tax=Polaribacter filamentus TaxID=53483 RepID=A0A2S7KYJ4_9FLAO|nr:hypothetical protein BST83_11675 [Polaribacter filamentus]